MSKKVKKTLDPKEQEILANVQALLGQLGQMNSEETMEEEVMEQEDVNIVDEKMEGEEENELTMAKKAIEETQSEGATASDTAEEQIEENQPDTNEKNVDEVAKTAAIVASVLKEMEAARSIKKSKPVDPKTKILSDLTNVVKNQNEKYTQLEKAMKGILDGLGVSKQMEIAEKKKEEKVQKSQGNDSQALIAAINALANKNVEKKKYESPSQGVHKSLENKEILAALCGRKTNGESLSF